MNDYSNQAQYEFSKRLAEFTDRNGSISEREEAILYAQAVEMQLLKAPQTAVFPSIEQFSVVESNGSYKVSGFVDSQNSYGASIRTPFTINVNKQGGSWSCSDKFISTNASIGAQVAGNTILFWILGIIGTIITYFIISSAMGLDLFDLF